LLGIKLDPYERSFRLVRLHVLLPREKELTAENLMGAIKDGHCFIGFDIFADASGFRFSADSGSEKKIMGDEIKLSGNTRLMISAPLNNRVVLFKDGNAVQERSGLTTSEFLIGEKGVYRVEVYLSQLPAPAGTEPWVISNPIYVR
jgi:hypothetical protein